MRFFITFLLFSLHHRPPPPFLNLSFLCFLLSFILYSRFTHGQFKAHPLLLRLRNNSFQVSFLIGGSMVRTVKSSKKTYELMSKIRSFSLSVVKQNKRSPQSHSQSTRSPLVLLLFISVAARNWTVNSVPACT